MLTGSRSAALEGLPRKQGHSALSVNRTEALSSEMLCFPARTPSPLRTGQLCVAVRFSITEDSLYCIPKKFNQVSLRILKEKYPSQSNFFALLRLNTLWASLSVGAQL